jgi:phosphate transport system protein
MAKHLHRELDKIKKRILSLGALTEERVHRTAEAIHNRDAAMAQKIIGSDWEIDEMEVEVEEECLKILALYQPVAVDLRFLVATIKINNDLERIGDEAVNISERVLTMAKRPDPGFVFDYMPMSEKSQAMLKMSLDALVNLDVDLAYKVITLDDEVDAIQKEAYDKIKEAIKQKPERLADHCTNIAEEVIYLIEGEIIRHGKYE